MQVVGTQLLYAGIDLLEDEVGSVLLAGLEAIGPDLHLDVEPHAADRFAAAILRRS